MTTSPDTREATETKLRSLREALDGGSLRAARRTLHSLHPAEIAQLLESLPPAKREFVWELVDHDDDGEVLLHVNDELRATLIRGMEDAEILAATEGLDVDDLADLVADLPAELTEQLLHSLDKQNRDLLTEVMSYDEDSAGGLMSPDTVTVRPDVTVDTLLRYLRMRGELPQHTDAVFVVNRYGNYLGMLALTTLITASPDDTVAEIMSNEVAGIPVELEAMDVVMMFEDRDLVSAPVVDDKGRLLGRITVDDVVDVMRDDAEHTMMSMAGLDEEEDMFAPIVRSARRRAIWLGINLATAFLAAWVVGRFQGTIDQLVALAVLMPIVASMGGIAGSQTLTLMIRGLALKQIHLDNAAVLVRREVAISMLNGILWAAVVGIVARWWFDDWGLGAVIAAAMAINLLAGTLAGFFVPLILKRMDVDPALAGSVVMTTVTDVIGFFSFLGLATIFLLP
jgi:magnesium transporter